MKLTKEEREAIYLSLSCRLGLIETGTMHRAVDAERSGQKHLIKTLNSSQYPTILMLENLMERILNDRE